MKPSVARPPEQDRAAIRRFSLFDAMVLIAASAVGLALDRAIYGGAGLPYPQTLRAIAISAPVVATWTIAVLVLSLRHPRFRRRRLLRRPGTEANCAATAALVLGAGLVGCTLWGDDPGGFAEVVIVMGVPIMAGSAVTAVWILSLLAGRFRAAPDWIDRLGRLMGFYWIASTLIVGWTLAGGR